jgi:hypothetical protein
VTTNKPAPKKIEPIQLFGHDLIVWIAPLALVAFLGFIVYAYIPPDLGESLKTESTEQPARRANETSDRTRSSNNRSTFSDTELKTCPDRLEVLGPFVQGLDALYDPAMDWDGDGVSCE